MEEWFTIVVVNNDSTPLRKPVQNPRSPSAHRGLSSHALVRLGDTASDLWRAGRAVLPALFYFAIIIIAATLGYIALGWPPFDAFYMVVITVFSVGYGEVLPLDTRAERVWTILVIFGGWSAVVITLSGIVKAVTEGEVRRVTEKLRKTRVMQYLHDHIIICGYGRVGQTLAHELHQAGLDFVILDRDQERVAQITVDGFLAHRGDATEEGVLEYIGIKRARCLATVLPQDALNVYITLTARDLNPDLKIIARGEQPSTEKKLLQAGANEVILPATIGGLRIAHAILQPEVSRLLHNDAPRDGVDKLDLRSVGLEVSELSLREHCGLLGKTVQNVHQLGNGEVMVLGVRRDSAILRQDLDAQVLREGDALIAITRSRKLPEAIGREVERMELL